MDSEGFGLAVLEMLCWEVFLVAATLSPAYPIRVDYGNTHSANANVQAQQHRGV